MESSFSIETVVLGQLSEDIETLTSVSALAELTNAGWRLKRQPCFQIDNSNFNDSFDKG